MNETINTNDNMGATLTRSGGIAESFLAPEALYTVQCVRDGQVIWEDSFHNTVMTLGKNDVLNKYFSNTAAGACYLGLISSVSYAGAPQATDTMSSHSNWTEAGNANAPTYTAPRKTLTAAWAAASSGSMSTSSAQSFAITGTGTVKGAFINIGGSSTIDNTTGILYSAGLFSGGDRAVINGDTLNVTVTLSA